MSLKFFSRMFFMYFSGLSVVWEGFLMVKEMGLCPLCFDKINYIYLLFLCFFLFCPSVGLRVWGYICSGCRLEESLHVGGITESAKRVTSDNICNVTLWFLCNLFIYIYLWFLVVIIRVIEGVKSYIWYGFRVIVNLVRYHPPTKDFVCFGQFFPGYFL